MGLNTSTSYLIMVVHASLKLAELSLKPVSINLSFYLLDIVSCSFTPVNRFGELLIVS